MTLEPAPTSRGPRTQLLAAGVGLALLTLGASLLVAQWPVGMTYPDEWVDYGSDAVVGLRVEGPSVGFVLGIALVALGAGVLGMVLGWGMTGRGGGGQVLVRLWRTHRALVVVAVGGALLVALGALLLANATGTSDDEAWPVVVARPDLAPERWTDVADMADGSSDALELSDGTVVSEVPAARFTSVQLETTPERAGTSDERVVGLLLGGLGLVLLGGVGGWLLAPTRER
ncbi:hypothetical protein [Cellulomonas persica]|uniref:Uncharacterized protein n=1 Tax=Cellulomonas persica TaxID=76861 RepID=A0A510USQ2_9CELL|nr:hypothetical protein [Cellulomonas persica]GEK17496.1 hypothetical protein CPE01_12290 [Cellulomonas persica]